jgi:RNA polymerase sigma-70 factor (ECF subfamily)
VTAPVRFDALVEEYRPMIARICASYEADRELARELVQDVLFAIWRALPAYRGDASLKTFVARIAQFRAISHAANQAQRPGTTELQEWLLSEDPAPELQAIEADRRNRLLNAVRQLPLAYRQVVTLTLEDFAPNEIASMLGVSANVISIRLTRARTALRSLLGEALHD